MAEMGKGKPVDALDSACKAWKECQRCARMKHNRSASHPQGEFECLGEFTRYNFGLKNDDYQCKNSANHFDVSSISSWIYVYAYVAHTETSVNYTDGQALWFCAKLEVELPW